MRTLLMAALCSLAAAAAFGQNSTIPNVSEIVAIGCISRVAPAAGRGASASYRLTDRRNTPPWVYRLDSAGTELDMEFHTGHLVEIHGTLSPNAGRGGAVTGGTIKIKSLIYLATRCGQVSTRS